MSNENLIFIVAYNHEELLEKVIRRIPDTVIFNPDNEILVIDDGSKDKTFFVEFSAFGKVPSL